MKKKVDDVDYLRTLVIEDSNGEFGHDQPTRLLINYLRTKETLIGSWICRNSTIKLEGYGCDHRGTKLTLNWDMTYSANSRDENRMWSSKYPIADGTWKLDR